MINLYLFWGAMKIFTILLNLLMFVFSSGSMVYIHLQVSGIQGQIQINGLSGSNNDWIAAFDESGNLWYQNL